MLKKRKSDLSNMYLGSQLVSHMSCGNLRVNFFEGHNNIGLANNRRGVIQPFNAYFVLLYMQYNHDESRNLTDSRLAPGCILIFPVLCYLQ